MSIPSSLTPLFNSGSSGGGLQISRSIRLNSADSAYLSRTSGTAGNRKTWTWAGWVKRSALSASTRYGLFGAANAPGTSYTIIEFYNDTIRFLDTNSGGTTEARITSAIYRDPSAWMNITLAYDTTQATASNRIKLYVNGSEVTQFSTSSNPSQNSDAYLNQAVPHTLGSSNAAGTPSLYFPGYLANIHFIDGQQLTPSSFTETDATTGQLIPKTYSGSYGTNGFNLLFADNSSNTASTLGKDTSGLSNNWTPNNFQVSAGTTYSNGTITGTAVNPWSYLFDGNFSTTPTSQSPGSTQLTLTQSISFTQLRVYANKNPSEILYVNGTGLTGIPTNVGASWVDITSQVSSPLTSIKVESLSSGQYSYIYAIEINGTELINGSASGIDSLVDSPTNYGTDTGVGGEVRGNYCVLNAVLPYTNVTLSNGNLDFVSGATYRNAVGTIGVSSGKWYWEVLVNTWSSDAGIGITNNPANVIVGFLGSNSSGWAYSPYPIGGNGSKYGNGAYVAYGATYTNGDTIGVALDADTGTLTFYKNGSSQGTAFTGLAAGTYFPALGGGSATSMTLNAGQRAFAYTAPSGFKALCTQNLPEGTITTSGTYTGNGVADGPFVYLNGVPTAMTVGGNAVTFGTHADKLSNGFKLRTTSTTYNQNALSYSYSITTTGAKFKYARAQPNP
jgi:SPRY domain